MTTWRDQAECRTSEADPALFDLAPDTFADQQETPTDAARRHAHALRVCAACPVRTPCLGDAIANNDVGVRGGQVIVGLNGMARERRMRLSVVATGRAVKVLNELPPPRRSFRGLTLGDGAA